MKNVISFSGLLLLCTFFPLNIFAHNADPNQLLNKILNTCDKVKTLETLKLNIEELAIWNKGLAGSANETKLVKLANNNIGRCTRKSAAPVCIVWAADQSKLLFSLCRD